MPPCHVEKHGPALPLTRRRGRVPGRPGAGAASCRRTGRRWGAGWNGARAKEDEGSVVCGTLRLESPVAGGNAAWPAGSRSRGRRLASALPRGARQELTPSSQNGCQRLDSGPNSAPRARAVSAGSAEGSILPFAPFACSCALPQAARGKEPPGGLPTSAGTGSLAWRWRCSARLRSRPGGGGEALVPRVLLLRGSDRFGAGFVFRGDTLLRRRSRVACPEMAGGAGAAAAWRFSVAPGNTRGEHEAGFLQQLPVALVHSEITGASC